MVNGGWGMGDGELWINDFRENKIAAEISGYKICLKIIIMNHKQNNSQLTIHNLERPSFSVLSSYELVGWVEVGNAHIGGVPS